MQSTVAKLCLVGAVCVACKSADPASLAKDDGATAGAAGGIRILAITDFHGQLEPVDQKGPGGVNLQVGGAPLLKAYVDGVRSQANGPHVLIDAGDIFQGTLMSNSTEGKPVIEFYKMLDVRASAVGNHEFDYGPSGPDAVPRHDGQDPRGALKDRVQQARTLGMNHNFYALNIKEQSGEAPNWLLPSKIITEADVTIGVIGATALSTRSTTNLKNVEDLKFITKVPELAAAITAEAQRLRGEMGTAGKKLVVLTAHEGGVCLDSAAFVDMSKINDLSTCRGEIFDIARALPPGSVDVIVAGHTHQPVYKVANGILIMQAASNGRMVMWADASFDGSAPRLTYAEPMQVCSQYVEVNGHKGCDREAAANPAGRVVPGAYQPAADVVALLRPYQEAVDALKNEQLGLKTAADFTTVYTTESALPNLITDMMRVYARTDIGFYNNGGVRAPLKGGSLKFGDVFNVLPFDDGIASIKVKGEALRRLMEKDVAKADDGGYAWGNVTATQDDCRLSIKVGKEPLDDNRTYSIVTAAFIANKFGSMLLREGEQASAVAALFEKPVELDITARDALIKALRQTPAATSADGIKPETYFNPNKLRVGKKPANCT